MAPVSKTPVSADFLFRAPEDQGSVLSCGPLSRRNSCFLLSFLAGLKRLGVKLAPSTAYLMAETMVFARGEDPGDDKVLGPEDGLVFIDVLRILGLRVAVVMGSSNLVKVYPSSAAGGPESCHFALHLQSNHYRLRMPVAAPPNNLGLTNSNSVRPSPQSPDRLVLSVLEHHVPDCEVERWAGLNELLLSCEANLGTTVVKDELFARQLQADLDARLAQELYDRDVAESLSSAGSPSSSTATSFSGMSIVDLEAERELQELCELHELTRCC